MEHREAAGNAGRTAFVKKRIFEIIQIGRRTDIPSICFDIAIILVILVNISITFLQTFEEMAEYAGAMGAVEFVTMAIFLVEYILRIWTADCLYPEKAYPAAVLRFGYRGRAPLRGAVAERGQASPGAVSGSGASGRGCVYAI
ncbi:ion transporter [uncultured Acetatifactor sp.]|uniref:ion transporter n=1 Tax=uncultured Acetatifactor sp. TaxID=1671927 RepID=UPI00260F91DB|nr:ion transporter [uncultured Acetatifactor sp.]